MARRYPDDYQRIHQSIKDGQPIDEVTIAEWAEQWLKIRQRKIRPGSFCSDRSAVTKWIVPTIGDKPLSGLQRSDLRAVHEAMEVGGVGPLAVERAHRVLKLMLGDAVDEGHEVPERTLRAKGPGSAGTPRRQALSIADARKVLDVAMTRPDASRWVAALLQGMRPAEARGLRWSALDLERGLMTIEWQLQRLPYNAHRDPTSGFRTPRGYESIHLTDAHHLVRPKTAAGVRVVPMVGWLRTELAAWRAICPDSPYGLVWTHPGNARSSTPPGHPITDIHDRRNWGDIVTVADVWVDLADGTRRRPLLYEARHTAATLLMASGADETTLTAIIGHSKIASTRAYLHSDETRKLSALESVGAQLGIGG